MPETAHIHSASSHGHSPSRASQEGSSLPLRIGDYFPEEPELRAQYSDEDIREISTHLQSRQPVAWSYVPRLYIVLRTIGQLQSLDDIISHGVNDYWFPFNANSVQAITLSSPMQNRFLEAQKLVLTKAVDLEKHPEKRHFHFGRGDTSPFKGLGEIGRGGYATVDKVFSHFSRREYARKLFKRQRGGNRTAVQSFINELRVLKKIHHRHCVELIASYTDAKYFGIVMSPIADGNLHGFYVRVSQNPEDVKVLRTFFGCLTGAVEYLHNSKIRHRDIKPENILVKGSDVYLTDFGISLDWENLSRGTTTADSGKTRLYCAPEVANSQLRNSSSDIWSLGCVFLEMCTVLKGRTTDEMQQSFKKRSDTHAFHANLSAIQDWLNTLRVCGSELDDAPLEWSALMLQSDRNLRPLAQNLHKMISKYKSISDRATSTFCAGCCVVDDDESTVGSASDGELWADDLDDIVTSPVLNSEIAKADGSESCGQEALSSNSGSSVQPGSMHPLSQLPTAHQTPSFPVDWTNDSHGSLTSGQNVADSEFPSESSSHSPTKIKLSFSSDQFGDDPVASKASLVETHSLPTLEAPRSVREWDNLTAESVRSVSPKAKGRSPEQSALSKSSDTVSQEQTYIHPEGSEKQFFAMSPDPDTVKPLERRASDESPPAQASKPDIRTAQENSVDINESCREYVFVKLPKLSPLDWKTPSTLLGALEKDEQITNCFHYYHPEFQALPKSDPGYICQFVLLLIENGLDVNSEAYQDENGFSPLVCVLQWSETDDFESLLSFMIGAGADLSIRVHKKPDKPGVSLFWLAAALGSVWAVDALISYNVSKPSAWLSDLHRSSLINDQPRVLKMLINHKWLELDFTPQDDFKVACENGSEGVLQILLDDFAHRIDIEKRDEYFTPLFKACAQGNLGVVRVLLAHGASPNENNRLPHVRDVLFPETALAGAARLGHANVVKLILEVAGDRVMVNGRSDGCTALYLACMSGHEDAAQHLLAHGANPNITRGNISRNWSCLHHAASDGRTDLVKSLLDHGATASIHLSRLFSGIRIESCTPLSLAQRAGHMEIVEMLIMAKAREKFRKTQKGKGGKKPAPHTIEKNKLAPHTTEKDKPAPDIMEMGEPAQDIRGKEKTAQNTSGLLMMLRTGTSTAVLNGL